MVRVRDDIDIGEDEIGFSFSRSSGPGGQNVNKVATRVTVLWDVQSSKSVNDADRTRIRRRLAGRINREGILRVTSSRHRTRKANRTAALIRFAELLSTALERRPPRVPTKPTRAAKERRLAGKRRRGLQKRERSRRVHPDTE